MFISALKVPLPVSFSALGGHLVSLFRYRVLFDCSFRGYLGLFIWHSGCFCLFIPWVPWSVHFGIHGAFDCSFRGSLCLFLFGIQDAFSVHSDIGLPLSVHSGIGVPLFVHFGI